jgi:hypothetical protein
MKDHPKMELGAARALIIHLIQHSRTLKTRLRGLCARLIPRAESSTEAFSTDHLRLAYCVHYEHCVAARVIVAMGASESHARHLFMSKTDTFLHPGMRICRLADAGSVEELGMMAALVSEFARQQVARQSVAHADFYGEFVVYSK